MIRWSRLVLSFVTLKMLLTVFVFSFQFLAYLAPFSGGLSSIAVGLFHPDTAVRKSVAQLLHQLEEFPVSDASSQVTRRRSYRQSCHSDWRLCRFRPQCIPEVGLCQPEGGAIM